VTQVLMQTTRDLEYYTTISNNLIFVVPEGTEVSVREKHTQNPIIVGICMVNDNATRLLFPRESLVRSIT